MKLTEIPSPIPCETKEYVLEAFDNRCNFQVYDGKIEHVSDFEMFAWARGKTMDEVVEWVKNKELEAKHEVHLAKERKQRNYTEVQKRLMLYAEEDRKRKIWEYEHYTEGEKGEGYFVPH